MLGTGTRVPGSIPGPGYPFHYPGTRVKIITRTLLNEILFSVLFLHSYFVFSVFTLCFARDCKNGPGLDSLAPATAQKWARECNPGPFLPAFFSEVSGAE